MALTAAQHNRAALDHNMKLRFEASLRRRIVRLHRRMLRLYLRELQITGVVIDFQIEFGNELREMLNAHYDRLGNAFTRSIDRQIKVLSIVISKYFTVRSVEQSRAITKVTQRHADEALITARLAAAAASVTGEVALTELEIATNAGGIFKQLLNGRTAAIVMHETNWPAEAAKLTQVEILAGEAPTITGGSARPSKQQKSWANLGDSRVRTGEFNHLRAEQTVPANRPFIVSGERLNFPGDLSLGASLGNVIRCRCSAVYEELAL